MKIWVDDLRDPPVTGKPWIVARNSEIALELLRCAVVDHVTVDTLSLDHDLGGDDDTRAIVNAMCSGEIPWPRKIWIHSANVVGREWLRGTIKRYAPYDTLAIP